MKLYYFDIPGRAESIRLLLHHAKVQYQDIRIKPHDWQSMKNDEEFDFHTVPVLELSDGTRINQSHSILEFLGIQYGYLNVEEETIYKIKNVMELVEDLFCKFTESMFPMNNFNYDEETIRDLKDKFINEVFPCTLEKLEQKLAENPNSKDFFVGQKLSILDFYIQGIFANFRFPGVKQIMDDIINKYKIFQAYLNKRKDEFENYFISKNSLSYKLYSLEGKNRAESIKLLFIHARVPFEDFQMKPEQWLNEKKTGKFEFDSIPAIEENGKIFINTEAILQRLGSKWNYFPTNIETQYQINTIICACKEVLDQIIKILPGSSLPLDFKKKIIDNLIRQVIPNLFIYLESKLKTNLSQEYLVGKHITIADFYFLGSIYFHCIEGDVEELVKGIFTIFDKFPLVKAYSLKRIVEFKR